MGESWGYDVVDPFLANEYCTFTLTITYQNLVRKFDVRCDFNTGAVTSKLLTTRDLETNEIVYGTVWVQFPRFLREDYVVNDRRLGWLQETVLPIADRAFFEEIAQLRQAQAQGVHIEEALAKITGRVAKEIFEQRIRPKDMPLAPTSANKVTNYGQGNYFTQRQLF